MKEEKINCMICHSPIAIIRLCNDSLEFNKDIEIEILDALVCEECLKNKDIITNINKIWDKNDDEL